MVLWVYNVTMVLQWFMYVDVWKGFPLYWRQFRSEAPTMAAFTSFPTIGRATPSLAGSVLTIGFLMKAWNIRSRAAAFSSPGSSLTWTPAQNAGNRDNSFSYFWLCLNVFKYLQKDAKSSKAHFWHPVRTHYLALVLVISLGLGS